MSIRSICVINCVILLILRTSCRTSLMYWWPDVIRRNRSGVIITSSRRRWRSGVIGIDGLWVFCRSFCSFFSLSEPITGMLNSWRINIYKKVQQQKLTSSEHSFAKAFLIPARTAHVSGSLHDFASSIVFACVLELETDCSAEKGCTRSGNWIFNNLIQWGCWFLPARMLPKMEPIRFVVAYNA